MGSRNPRRHVLAMMAVSDTTISIVPNRCADQKARLCGGCSSGAQEWMTRRSANSEHAASAVHPAMIRATAPIVRPRLKDSSIGINVAGRIIAVPMAGFRGFDSRNPRAISPARPGRNPDNP